MNNLILRAECVRVFELIMRMTSQTTSRLKRRSAAVGRRWHRARDGIGVGKILRPFEQIRCNPKNLDRFIASGHRFARCTLNVIPKSKELRHPCAWAEIVWFANPVKQKRCVNLVLYVTQRGPRLSQPAGAFGFLEKRRQMSVRVFRELGVRRVLVGIQQFVKPFLNGFSLWVLRELLGPVLGNVVQRIVGRVCLEL